MQDENKNIEKKSPKWIFLYNTLKGFIVLLLLFLNLITLALATPSIQNAFSAKITNYLSSRTGYNVSMRHIELDMNAGLQLNDIQILDLNNDTLVRASYINTSILRNLIPMVFNKNYNFSRISINDGLIKVLKKQGDSLSNLQTFIYRLNLPKSKSSECTKLTLRNLSVNHTKVVIDLYDEPVMVRASIGESVVKFKKFNLCNKEFRISVIDVFDPEISILSRKKNAAGAKIQQAKTFSIPMNITIDNIHIKRGSLISKNGNIHNLAVYRNSFVDFNDLDLNSIELDAKNIDINDSLQWRFSIPNLTFNEKSGFQIINLSVEQGFFSNKKLMLQSLELKTHESEISSDLKMVYKNIRDFKDFENNVYIDIKFFNSYLTISDLAYFLRNYKEKEGLEKLQRVKISLNGKISGFVNDFKTDNIELSVQDQLALSSDIQCKNLTDPELLFFNVNNLKLKSTSGFITELLPGIGLSERFQKFGNLDFTGSFFGYIKEFNTKGIMKTDIGKADVDLYMNFKNGENIKYYGQLLLNDFQLGYFLDQKNVGNVGGRIFILNGTNLTPETVNSDFKAQIDSIGFNDYTYRNVKIDGLLKAKTFLGELSVNDINFDLKLNGKIDYQDSVPVFNFKAKLTDADMKALKLYGKDLYVNTEVELDIFGDRAENFIGKINFNNVEISNGQEIATLDSISIYSAININGERYLDADSDILTFYFDGKYRLGDLKKSVFSIFDRHFSKFLVGFDQMRTFNENFNDFYYNFNLSVYNSENFFQVLTGKPFKVINFSLDGNAYHLSDSIKMEVRFDSLKYDKYVATGFKSDFNLYQGYGDFQLSTRQIIYDKINIGNITFNSDVDEDELYFHTNIDSISTENNSISFSGKTVPHRDSFEIQLFGGYLTIMNDVFDFSGENRMILGKEYINFYDFSLTENESRIFIEDVNNNRGIKLNFRQFDAEVINLLIKYDRLNFSGKTNGYIEIADIFKPEIFESEIEIPDLMVNGDFLGSFKSHVLIDPVEKNKLQFNAIIGSENPILLATGKYDFKNKSFFGDFTLDDYPLSFLEHIIQDGISETTGVLDGNLIIKGPVKQININGSGLVTGGSTKVNFLGSKYFFDQQRFTLNNNGIDFKDVEISDELGNVGKVVFGGIKYSRFKDWGVDIQLESDRIMSLNTTKDLNPDFWGFAVGKTKASFKGIFKDVVAMDIEITTARGSNLTIPVKLYVGTEGGSFINFSKKDTSDLSESANEINTSGIELELYVNVTEEATMTIIMDEKTGDYLKGNGNGIVRMVMNKDKDFDVYGDFKFVQGNYVFKYELLEFGLINKEFVIRPGSNILFSGGIYDAVMDIKADYRANRISLYNLLGEFNRVTGASYIADVDLILLLSGTLRNPEINFDFNFNNIDERIRSQVLSKMQKLKSDPNAVYTQAVSLLTFVTFVPDQSLNESFQNETFLSSGFAGGVNTISELIANQLSQYVTNLLHEIVIDSKVISGVDVSFDARYNSILKNTGQAISDDIGSQHLNMNATLWFYNDKIYVHFGGDYNYLDNGNTIASKSNYFSQGNVDIGYVVTKDKRLKVKLNFKTEFNEWLGNWENNGGIGISYGKDFGKVIKEK